MGVLKQVTQYLKAKLRCFRKGESGGRHASDYRKDKLAVTRFVGGVLQRSKDISNARTAVD